ncbi:hypothetical protein AAMO2058_001536600 [Amorphochlora amoebiformis]
MGRQWVPRVVLLVLIVRDIQCEELTDEENWRDPWENQKGEIDVGAILGALKSTRGRRTNDITSEQFDEEVKRRVKRNHDAVQEDENGSIKEIRAEKKKRLQENRRQRDKMLDAENVSNPFDDAAEQAQKKKEKAKEKVRKRLGNTANLDKNWDPNTKGTWIAAQTRRPKRPKRRKTSNPLAYR